jgi:hypothetical protein
MCLAPVIRLEEARKLSPAQILPWVSRNKFRPEGAGNADAVRFKGSEPTLAVSGGHFGPYDAKRTRVDGTPGNEWSFLTTYCLESYNPTANNRFSRIPPQ